MKFRRLKLTGFKSFVEPSELLIQPGLTGVVGPNGCGKSNLLEALRWVMGENSFKNMRASTMEDVIFSGSRTRPARNMAEVVLTLDNSARKAPPPYAELDTLEVSRRIERDKGSTYRINGKEVRARDVQLLFADASTGARSPALVRQGRVSQIINAKPAARRRILEEAAGITGLYTRRHEAELKLNATSANLERLEDVTGQLESQLNSLKRQARQATRYRDLSRRIKELEAAGLWLAWDGARRELQRQKAQRDETTRLLAQFTRLSSELSRKREELTANLAPLREQEATRGAVLQRLKVELESLRRAGEESERRKAELTARLNQSRLDIAREQEMRDDAEKAIRRLEEEERTLGHDGGDDQAHAEAARAMQAAASDLEKAQEKADAAQGRLSSLTARREALERAAAQARERLARLRAEARDIAARRQAAQQEAGDDKALAQAQQALHQAGQAVSSAEQAAAAAEEALSNAREAEQGARQSWNDARREAEKLATEVRTLEKVLGAAENDLFPPMIDALKVAPGMEAAIAAALGDDLDVPIDEAAPVHWRALPPLTDPAPLPPDARPLADFITGPAALARRLAMTALVDSEERARALQPSLKPGQRLVTREGGLWRWDGLSAAAEAPTAAARRLAERNRLEDLRARLERARAGAERAGDAHAKARARLDAARSARDEARKIRAQRAAALEEARKTLSETERARAALMSRMSALAEAESRIEADLAQAETALGEARAELAALPPADGLREELARLRASLEEARRRYAETRARHDSLQREAQMRTSRLKAIAEEKRRWAARIASAEKRMRELAGRIEPLRAEIQALSAAPKELEDKRTRVMNAIDEAEEARRQAADALAEAEAAIRRIEADWREAQGQLSGAREQAARLEERIEAAAAREREIAATIVERMECEPRKLPLKASLDTANLPAKEDIDRELMKLRDARERLGAVNLRADAEMEEVAAELEKLVAERDDLIKAIGKLRGAIASLNREGRKRLLEAFEQVNGYFASLFATLFGGGKAHLELIEADDPLEAGLEIFAQPPGKRTQTLSLLSGGEQTLTAMALIFAVFLTNPSPICVLDEVDAPLDEHNVERFCTLLEDMLGRADTDFLIITHHPITMARMHRLFGVTMMEPGVSRLVSVDLQTAESLREAS